MVTTPELIAIRRGQIRQLIEAGQTTSQIAQTLNQRRTVIVSDIRALGLTPAKAPNRPRNQARNDALAIQITALAEQRHNRSRMAKELGISYPFLLKLMDHYGITIAERIPEHGTHREYRAHGCRCAPCTAANAAATAEARAARKARLSPDSPIHGTVTGYSNHLCRCEPCTTAGVAFYADYRATPPTRTRRAWSPEEDTSILDYTRTAKEHAAALGRPVASVTSRRTHLKNAGILQEAAAEKRAAESTARKEAHARRMKAEAEAAAQQLAAATAAVQSRRGAVEALVMRGLTRQGIMATLEIDYETLRGDLEALNITPVTSLRQSPQRPSHALRPVRAGRLAVVGG